MSLLHTYRCKACGTVAVAAFRGQPGSAVACIMCHSFMTHLYSEPITTPEQQAFARRGIVYNPGVQPEEKDFARGGTHAAVGHGDLPHRNDGDV